MRRVDINGQRWESLLCSLNIYTVERSVPVIKPLELLLLVRLLDRVVDNDILHRAQVREELQFVCVVVTCIGLCVFLEVVVIVVSLYVLDKLCTRIIDRYLCRAFRRNYRSRLCIGIIVDINEYLFALFVCNIGEDLAVIGLCHKPLELDRLSLVIVELYSHTVHKVGSRKIGVVPGGLYNDHRCQRIAGLVMLAHLNYRQLGVLYLNSRKRLTCALVVFLRFYHYLGFFCHNRLNVTAVLVPHFLPVVFLRIIRKICRIENRNNRIYVHSGRQQLVENDLLAALDNAHINKLPQILLTACLACHSRECVVYLYLILGIACISCRFSRAADSIYTRDVISCRKSFSYPDAACLV